MKVLVAYDGTLQAKDALRYGMEKARESGGELLTLHIFESGRFIDYDAHHGALELARREFRGYAEEAKLFIKREGNGVRTSVFTGEGDPEEEVLRFANERNVDLLLCPPRYKSLIKKFRKMTEERGKETRENAILDDSEKLRMAMVSVQ